MPQFRKGSLEAKRYMAKMRAMRKPKMKSRGTKPSMKADSTKRADMGLLSGVKTKKKKVVKQTGTSVKKFDKLYAAKKPGKRIAKGTKKMYYENRANRSDKGKLLGIGSIFDTSAIKDLDSLKKQYLKLAKKYHPDAGGTTIQFQDLQNEYEKLFNQILRGSKLSDEAQKNEIVIDKEIRSVIDALVNVENLNVELIGKWLWISGETYPVRATLKSAGLTFIKKDGKPFWVYKGIESKSRGTMSMEEIKSKYGVHKIEIPRTKKISGGRAIKVNKTKLKKSLMRLKFALDKRPI